MTLHTRIAVLGETDIPALAEFVATDLLRVEKKPTLMAHSSWDPEDEHSYGFGFGNGFDAAFWIEYKDGQPLEPRARYYDDNYDKTDEETENFASPAMYSEINFDTAYGLKDSNLGPTDCSSLHAAYTIAIYHFLQERGVEIKWYNEYTGEWHDGISEIEELLNEGAKAGEWFANVVMPAIQRMCEGE